MTVDDYKRYVVAFNAKDYGTLEGFFADDFALENAGFRVEGKEGFRVFYAFFHDFVRESVVLKGFCPGDGSFVANVVIRFQGLRDLTPSILAAKGYAGMTPVPKDAILDVEFLILYVLNDQGFIQQIKGAVWIPKANS